ncbi:VPA1267 family protein [Pseudoalteromonas shioyasakiensis]|uniref:VPA1267 family protein n=1 Tax=Pseudoalteromonas shioyasakiensis TaxID=1190813 RepID=UPI002551F4FB|nr:VPA1267 family protein [Pseudoalteromonas shioyasakiensis]MDK9685480.1 VPA1267 family protein [Pseudoalteromonas shioyasakiensis]
MANGQQLGQENIAKFEIWVATQTDDDFKQIIHRGQLNRGTIAKEASIGKSALTQNITIKKALKALEDSLRERGILPPKIEKAKQDHSKVQEYDSSAKKKYFENNRIATLEAENLELKAEIAKLTGKLERFGEQAEALSELGIFPR